MPENEVVADGNKGLPCRLAGWLFWNRYVTFVCRLAVGGIFAFSGYIKLTEHDALLKAIETHDILPSLLEHWLAASLPWIELIVAYLLILGLFQRFGGVLALLLAIMFAIANCVSIARGLDFSCSCFGDVMTLDKGTALGVDVVIMAASLVVLFHKHKKEFLTLDSLCLPRGRKGKKVPDQGQ